MKRLVSGADAPGLDYPSPIDYDTEREPSRGDQGGKPASGATAECDTGGVRST